MFLEGAKCRAARAEQGPATVCDHPQSPAAAVGDHRHCSVLLQMRKQTDASVTLPNACLIRLQVASEGTVHDKVNALALQLQSTHIQSRLHVLEQLVNLAAKRNREHQKEAAGALKYAVDYAVGGDSVWYAAYSRALV